ncbi:MAG: hypothetical protein ACFFDF_09805 [Candidatus Odinarchaeota archaeon]
MQKLTIFKFFIPILILTSVFSGPFYNLLTFLNTSTLQSYWSFFYNNTLFADLMALSFLLFAILLIISIRYIDKIYREQLIVLCILFVGFCCIYASLIWVWELVILVFVVNFGATAYLIPTLGRYTSKILQKTNESSQYKIMLPIGILIWIFISFVLFYFFNGYWRFLYLITGIINILSSSIFVLI